MRGTQRDRDLSSNHVLWEFSHFLILYFLPTIWKRKKKQTTIISPLICMRQILWEEIEIFGRNQVHNGSHVQLYRVEVVEKDFTHVLSHFTSLQRYDSLQISVNKRKSECFQSPYTHMNIVSFGLTSAYQCMYIVHYMPNRGQMQMQTYMLSLVNT